MIAPFTVNDVLRSLRSRWTPSPGPQVAKVLRHLVACRTGQLGYTLWQCRDCARLHPPPNGCGDRHCATCQHARTSDWLARQRRDLLPVPYYHWVLTLPQKLRPLALQNPAAIYGLLFDAAGDSLLQLGQEHFESATLGITLVLHTWGQKLPHHPHVHGLVTGGGLRADGQWRAPNQQRWLLPVREVGARFRNKFLAGLQQLFTTGSLQFHADLAPLAQTQAFDAWREELRQQRWVVFAKGSVAGPEYVLDYLGRYAHRVALANGRLLSFDQVTGRVTFRYKDYADANRLKNLTLEGAAFLHRWALHVLPPGFTKIPHYALLAPNQRRRLLPLARTALETSTHRWQPTPPPPTTPPPQPLCPHCGSLRLNCIARIDRSGTTWPMFPHVIQPYLDSS